MPTERMTFTDEEQREALAEAQRILIEAKYPDHPQPFSAHGRLLGTIARHLLVRTGRERQNANHDRNEREDLPLVSIGPGGINHPDSKETHE